MLRMHVYILYEKYLLLLITHILNEFLLISTCYMILQILQYNHIPKLIYLQFQLSKLTL